LPVEPDAPHEASAPARSRVAAGSSAAGAHWQPAAVALVALGGFAGTWARYGLAELAPTRAGRWPWGTFAANLIGALVLGLLLESLGRRGPDTGVRRRLRLLLGVGFCGALTTFSTLAVETDLLVEHSDPALAFGYLAASLLGGLVLTGLGVAVAGRRAAATR
jgi:CrcB protein